MAGPYDVVVIGGGPGGYNAAIRCGQLGLKTAIVEMRPSSDGKGVALGGTCLNVGCIPSKALLHASQRFEEARDHFAPLGIKASVSLDLPGMLQHKTRTVATLVQGVAFLMKKNKAEVFFGRGRIGGPGKVIVAREGGEDTLETKHIIIATGSEVMPLPGVQVDERRIVSSTGALSLGSVPKTMIVIGGGYIGLEMGSVWRRLGAAVTVVEYLDRITPGLDSEVSKEFQKILTRQGISFKLGTKVTSAAANETGVTLTVEPAKGGAAETLSAEVVLVSIGRRPFTAGLGLEAAGVTLDSKGRIVTDGHYRTRVPGIWAVGDVIDGPMLAHKAEDEAMAVAELIAGKPGHVNYETIPAVVYTAPEVASCGKTEDELKAAGVAYKAGKFPFTANARAKTIAEKDGFVKILADAATDRVLGCHIIGPEAGNMIMEVALGMEFGASSEDIARTCHAHPTLPEAVRQAALAIDGRTTQI